MFCIKCGNKMVDGAKFCHACGNPVQLNNGNNGQPVQDVPNQPQGKEANDKKKTKKKFTPISTICFFAWVVFLFFSDQIFISVGKNMSNMIFIGFLILVSILSLLDIMFTDKKYSKGLSIFLVCFSVLVLVAILVF